MNSNLILIFLTTWTIVLMNGALCQKCEFTSSASILKCDQIVDLTLVDTSNATIDSILTVSIRPKDPAIFTGISFDGDEEKFKESFMLILENFDGFDVASNPFSNFNQQGRELEIAESKFEFSLFGSPLNGSCLNGSLTNKPILASFKSVTFDESITFEKNTCPDIFKDCNILRLIISGISDSNYLGFTNLNALINLNSSVFSYEIFKSSLKSVDNSLLNSDVFKKLSKFAYHSSESLFEIKSDLFVPFKFLIEFELIVPNFEHIFLNQTTIKWINSINSDLNVDLSNDLEITSNAARQAKLVLNDFSKSYLYPLEDLCTFINFPHSHLIYPVIETAPDIECKNLFFELIF